MRGGRFRMNYSGQTPKNIDWILKTHATLKCENIRMFGLENPKHKHLESNSCLKTGRVFPGKLRSPPQILLSFRVYMKIYLYVKAGAIPQDYSLLKSHQNGAYIIKKTVGNNEMKDSLVFVVHISIAFKIVFVF